MRLWDRESGQCLRVFDGHTDRITSVAYAPDGHTLLSAAYDKTVRLWDLATGACLKIILPLPDAQHACLSGDGRRVISASAEAWRYLEARIAHENADDDVLPVEAVTGPWAQVIGAAT
ncbi:MAG: hypothetical protein MUE46_05445 [Xanthomonadales bacterium]|nr:hypothetical protein [Xanthomonadales bacterium]